MTAPIIRRLVSDIPALNDGFFLLISAYNRQHFPDRFF